MQSPGRNSNDINFYVDEIVSYIKTIVSPIQFEEIDVRPSQEGDSVTVGTVDSGESTIQTWMLRMFLYKHFFEYYDIIQITHESECEGGRSYINPIIGGEEYYHPYISEQSVTEYIFDIIRDFSDSSFPNTLCENPSLVCANFTEDECKQEIGKYNRMLEECQLLDEGGEDTDELGKILDGYTCQNLEETLYESELYDFLGR